MPTRRVTFANATLTSTRSSLVTDRGRVLWACMVGGAAAESVRILDLAGNLLFPVAILVPIATVVPMGPFDIVNGFAAETSSAAGDVCIFGEAEVDL